MAFVSGTTDLRHAYPRPALHDLSHLATAKTTAASARPDAAARWRHYDQTVAELVRRHIQLRDIETYGQLCATRTHALRLDADPRRQPTFERRFVCTVQWADGEWAAAHGDGPVTDLVLELPLAPDALPLALDALPAWFRASAGALGLHGLQRAVLRGLCAATALQLLLAHSYRLRALDLSGAAGLTRPALGLVQRFSQLHDLSLSLLPRLDKLYHGRRLLRHLALDVGSPLVSLRLFGNVDAESVGLLEALPHLRELQLHFLPKLPSSLSERWDVAQQFRYTISPENEWSRTRGALLVVPSRGPCQALAAEQTDQPQGHEVAVPF